MKMALAIAFGGGLGALSRHYASHRVAEFFGHTFPYGTLAVNVVGSFIMGMMVTLFAQKFALSQEMRAFLTVGLLGGFTTFSAFSLEAALLIEWGAYGPTAAYVTASILFAVGGLFAGIWLARALV